MREARTKSQLPVPVPVPVPPPGRTRGATLAARHGAVRRGGRAGAVAYRGGTGWARPGSFGASARTGRDGPQEPGGSRLQPSSCRCDWARGAAVLRVRVPDRRLDRRDFDAATSPAAVFASRGQHGSASSAPGWFGWRGGGWVGARRSCREMTTRGRAATALGRALVSTQRQCAFDAWVPWDLGDGADSYGTSHEETADIRKPRTATDILVHLVIVKKIAMCRCRP
jgi:hypothetical protein